MGTASNGHKQEIVPKNGYSPNTGYDLGTEDSDGSSFAWDTAVTDAVGACAAAVVQAGDMFMITTDKGRFAVHIVIRSNKGGHDKWYNDPAKLVKALDRLYDQAIAKLNSQNPPKLLP